ncbi:DUF4199 domain-containing protein [Mucilaginibacter sp. BT774]|uniref:DUF4199 domain-containing protein n=1 Tax=Mucilaginibacter sp. BT774 TaxID=3062276 RepID=UPI002676A623|nr:DUF4199 domain-containing protein [Mucilaginibacter sp. BT774]MDO3627708.1 DUF4199 domain-containing protein [Mucilaginibacter sp. BT774]
MEQTAAPSSAKIAIKWSLIYVLVAIVITYASEIAKLSVNSPVKYVTYVFLIVFLLLAQKEHRDKLGGYIKFGDAFVTGLLYGIFAGVLTAVFVYIYLSILSPEIFAQAIDQQRQAMVDSGKMSSDQIDHAMDIAKKYGPILGAIVTVFLYAILGVIVGLIGAAIFKKEPSIYSTPDSSTM